MSPVKTYDYLLLSRARVLAAIRALSDAEYRREFVFGLKTISSTVTHTMLSEWCYLERLEGRQLPPYATWPIQYEKPPAFDIIEATWTPQAACVRAHAAAATDWSRVIRYTTLPDENGKRFNITAAAGDIFTQLVLHEVHHRAQIMAMLRMMGHPIEDIDYNSLMYTFDPIA